MLLLVAAGFILTAGTASAHEGRLATDTHEYHTPLQAASAAHDLHGYAASEIPADWAMQADHASHGSAPCSGGHAGGHKSGTCCTVACHAVLAAYSIGFVGRPELPSTRIVALVGMLEGRSSDCTERPPKHD